MQPGVLSKFRAVVGSFFVDMELHNMLANAVKLRALMTSWEMFVMDCISQVRFLAKCFMACAPGRDRCYAVLMCALVFLSI